MKLYLGLGMFVVSLLSSLFAAFTAFEWAQIERYNPSLTSTLQLWEAVWLVINSHGFVYTSFNVLDAWESHRAAVYPPRDDIGADAALLSLIVQCGLLLVQLLFLAVGVLASFTIPAIVEEIRIASTLAIIFGFICSALALDVMSYVVRKLRRRMFRKLRLPLTRQERKEKRSA